MQSDNFEGTNTQLAIGKSTTKPQLVFSLNEQKKRQHYERLIFIYNYLYIKLVIYMKSPIGFSKSTA